MPKIFEYFWHVFYFYSREHLPIHVHADYETIFEIIFYDGKVSKINTCKSKGSD
jgi:Domain of unknown function (DUF4160)